MFDINDIHAGMLLTVTNTETNDQFNMTVLPGIYNEERDGLGCCCPEIMWFPLSCFDEHLVYSNYRIDRVFGYTNNRHLLVNDIAYRNCLWERTVYDSES